MNKTIATIKTRRAIRQYKNKPISKELIEEILECGRLAPNAMNRQNWRFIIITDKAKIKELSDAITKEAMKEYPHIKERIKTKDDPIFYSAPLLIMILKPKGYKWGDFDCACAAQNMMLAAKSLGIGSCPIGMSRLLDFKYVPDDYEISITLTFGYPDEEPEVKERFDNVIKWL